MSFPPSNKHFSPRKQSFRGQCISGALLIVAVLLGAIPMLASLDARFGAEDILLSLTELQSLAEALFREDRFSLENIL